MITSTKGDFRINLRRYCALKPKKSTYCKTFNSCVSNSNMEITLPQDKSINPSIYNYDNLHKLEKQILVLYERNIQFYRLNQQKLLKAILNEMKDKNYVYQIQILNFLKNRESIKLKQSINQKKLQQQLEMLIKFLLENYERKRVKQLLIIKQNIKQEQKIISDKVSLDDLEIFHQNMEFTQASSNCDFISQYQIICMKFGTPELYLKPHIKIKDQIDHCKENLKMHFDQSKQEKAKYLYIRKKLN